MFLTADELEALTGRKVRRCQRQVLSHLGIEHRVRPDGSLVVLRAHVEQSLGATPGGGGAKLPAIEPNWSAI